MSNHSEKVRQLTEISIAGRLRGETMEVIAITEHVALSTLFVATSKRSIKKHCPDLLDDFVASYKRKVSKNEHIVLILVQKLHRGDTINEVYREMLAQSGFFRAFEMTRRAARLAVTSNAGEYARHVSAVIAGSEPEEPPAINSLSIFEIHVKKTEKQKPKNCSKCGCVSNRRKKLFKFWLGGSPLRQEGGVLQYLCRECLCSDDPEISTLEEIFVNHQRNQQSIAEVMWT